MTGKPIGIGVIGTGFGVRVQIPVWLQTPGVRVTAVCSSSKARAEQVAQRFGIPHAVTFARELAELPDVHLVCVATPPHLHYEGSMAAIAAGKHVLCDKPFALDERQGFAMLEAAKKRGVLHLTNYEFRTVPARLEMRRRIQEGEIGKIMHAHVTTFGNFVYANEGRTARWWYEAKSGGGWIGASGSHTIDMLRFLFGEITGVSAQLDTYVKDHRLIDGSTIRTDVDDTFFLLFRFASGAMGAFLSGAAIAAGGAGMRLEAYGMEGTLALEGDKLFGAKKGERKLELIPTATLPMPTGVTDPHYAPFLAWTRLIVEAIQQERHIAPSFYDGWRSQQVIDAARQSQREGRWVEIAP